MPVLETQRSEEVLHPLSMNPTAYPNTKITVQSMPPYYGLTQGRARTELGAHNMNSFMKKTTL